MRIQHNIMPPLPGRGGNRKKRRIGDPEAMSHQHQPQPPTDGYTTFKLDQQIHYDVHGSELDDGRMSPGGPFAQLEIYQSSFPHRRSLSPEVIMVESDGEDDMPPHLAALQDPDTGLILGRSPAMVKYIIWKAKHQYALQEHESLIEELRTLRYEEKCWKERKDALLDEVLRMTFG